MEEFLQNPNPKRLDPAKMVKASEPFNVDDFVSVIHKGRDVKPQDL